MNFKHLLHGHSRRETIERYTILAIVVGVLIAGVGMVATIFGTKGAATVVTLVGSFITFVFTVVLVLWWFVRGDK